MISRLDPLVRFARTINMPGRLNMPFELNFLQSASKMSSCKPTFRFGHKLLGRCMALIKCKECGHQVSSTAQACPNCGAQVARKPIGCGSAIVIVFLALVIAVSAQLIFHSDTSPSAPSSPPEPTINTLPSPQVSKPEPVFEDVKSITVYGKKIKIGTTSDAVVEILAGYTPEKQDVMEDHSIRGSLIVQKYYRADSKHFSLTFARKRADGPYIVHSIFVEKQP